MSGIRKMACPCCGASLPAADETGKTVCAYCGQQLSVKDQPQVKEQPEKKTAEPAPEVRIIRPKRNALDIILIVLGGLWCLIVLAVAIDLKYWKRLTEIIAALMLAAPGIVLLLIGFRRKKVKIVRGGLPGAKK